MAERITLDPGEVAGSRTAFDITPWLGEEGIDWGDGEIQAYMADQSRGATPIDFRVPNRTVQMQLMLKGVGGTAFASARALVQAKAALFQREGGWLKRVTTAGGTVYADVVSASLRLGGGWAQSQRDFDVDATLTLECLPDFYEAERVMSDHVETSAAELVWTETDIDGDYPARTRIVIDEDQGRDQLGLVWSVRGQQYSAAATAATRFEAEALTPLDTAARAALSGASGGTAVTHGTLSTDWTPVLDMRAGGTAYPTHTGTNRMWVRYRTTSGTAVELRVVYDVADLVSPIANSPVGTYGGAVTGIGFYTVDLGELRLKPTPVGTHRWNGVIQARGAQGGENVSIDKVWILNSDDGYGVLRAPARVVSGLQAATVRDDFNQTAGALNGKSVQLGGGTWSTFANGVSATDLSVNASTHTLTKSALESYRGAIAGTGTLTSTILRLEFTYSALSATGSGRLTLIARQVSQDSFIGVQFTNSGSLVMGRFTAFSGGTTSITGSFGGLGQTEAWAAGITYVAVLYVGIDGRTTCWLVRKGEALGTPAAIGMEPTAATGGILQSGKVGFAESYSGPSTVTRTYDNFSAGPATTDAVLYASQSMELRSDGVFREDSTGTAFGPVSEISGALPRLPPTVEGRTTEVFVKASRGDFDTVADDGIDDISARVTYRPCWLIVPGT